LKDDYDLVNGVGWSPFILHPWITHI